MKKDINVYYDTYGFEGERDYAIDGNGEYQPSDYDEMYDTNDHISIKRQRNPTPVRINLSKIFCNTSLIHSKNLLTMMKCANVTIFVLFLHSRIQKTEGNGDSVRSSSYSLS